MSNNTNVINNDMHNPMPNYDGAFMSVTKNDDCSGSFMEQTETCKKKENNSSKSPVDDGSTILNNDEFSIVEDFFKENNDNAINKNMENKKSIQPVIVSSNHNISNNNFPISKITHSNNINNISNNNLPIESNKSIASHGKSKKEKATSKKEKTTVINSIVDNQKYFVNTQVNDVNSAIMSNPYCEKSQKTIEQSKSSVKTKSSVKKHFNPFYIASKQQSTDKNKNEFNNAALNNNFNDKSQYNQLCSNLDYYGVSQLAGTNKNSEKEIYINNIYNIDGSKRKYRSSSVDSSSIYNSSEYCSHCGHRIKRINNRKDKVKYCCCNNCCNNKCNIF